MTIEVWEVDLDSHSSVISFINRINSELPRLDGFVCNAGVGLKTFEVSENLERSLTINVISTFLVGIGVLPKLKETSALHATETNLTIVGSMIHIFGLDAQLQLPEGMKIFDALSDSKTADMNGRYPLSKLIVHQCFNELAERASSSASDKGHRVVINIVNPAWCKTELFQYKAEPLPVRIILALIGRTAEEGSRTLVHGVTAGKETHGRYLSECHIKPQSHYVRSERGRLIQKRLWEEVVQKIEQISPEIADFVKLDSGV